MENVGYAGFDLICRFDSIFGLMCRFGLVCCLICGLESRLSFEISVFFEGISVEISL